jgi:hypothetical protein
LQVLLLKMLKNAYSNIHQCIFILFYFIFINFAFTTTLFYKTSLSPFYIRKCMGIFIFKSMLLFKM